MTWFDRLHSRFTFPTNSRHDRIAVLCGPTQHHLHSHLNIETASPLTAPSDYAKGTTGEETFGLEPLEELM